MSQKSPCLPAWKVARNALDYAAKQAREAEEKHNACYWTKDLPGRKQWTTIADFGDLKNRILCLLRKYQDPRALLVSFDFDGTLVERVSCEKNVTRP